MGLGDPAILSARTSFTNFAFPDIQLDCYKSLLIDFHKYCLALKNVGGIDVTDPRYVFMATLKQFVTSVQYLFYEYMTSELYVQDKEKYGWKYQIEFKDYHTVHVLDPKKTPNLDPILLEMMDIVNQWSQSQGCFRTYNEKIKFKDFWDELDNNNA